MSTENKEFTSYARGWGFQIPHNVDVRSVTFTTRDFHHHDLSLPWFIDTVLVEEDLRGKRKLGLVYANTAESYCGRSYTTEFGCIYSMPERSDVLAYLAKSASNRNKRGTLTAVLYTVARRITSHVIDELPWHFRHNVTCLTYLAYKLGHPTLQNYTEPKRGNAKEELDALKVEMLTRGIEI